MSHCPSCQRPCRPNFCDACFLSLVPSKPGRFEQLLARDTSAVADVAPTSTAGPDLFGLRYQPPGWWRRRLRPGIHSALSFVLVLGMTLGAVVGAVGLYRWHSSREAEQRARAHLQLCQQAEVRKLWEEALSQAELGLARAEKGHDEGLVQELESHAGRSAFQARRWEQAYHHLRAAQHSGPELSIALDNLRKQRRSQALSLLAQARQQIVEGQAATALKSVARAQALLEAYRGSPGQLAEVHYLQGRILQRMSLVGDARDQLRVALRHWPGHSKARQLLAQLEVKPQKPAASPLPRPARSQPSSRTEEVLVPRLDTGPEYPTYQPPDDDEDEDRLDTGSRTRTSIRSDSRSRSSSSKSRSRRSGGERNSSPRAVPPGR